MLDEVETPPVETISAASVKTMLADGGEIAFLDVREHGQYGEGHPFFAVNCPYSRLEIDVVALVPNPECRVVLFDDGDGVSERAAERLREIGYSRLMILEGGANAWQAAGYVLFKGVNVPSKAFGELVEETLETPSISAEELKAMIESGEDMVVLDGRSPAEYAKMNIPTARSCPNGELPYRITDFAPDPSTKVVINCAGRTRSIIGTQTLVNLGIPNPVMALRNGSQGWQLAGFELEYGRAPGLLPEPGSQESADKRAHFISDHAIATATMDQLRAWQADAGRSTYLFDIRTLEEFEKGHLPGAVHAPGGQLVQATDHWVGVRNARIILCDNKSLRAPAMSYWLSLMGHQAIVLDCDVTAQPNLAIGSQAAEVPLPEVKTFAPDQLPSMADAVLIDVSASLNFRQAHLRGARWGIRPRLSAARDDQDRPIVVMARDPRVAVLAANELASKGCRNVSVLEGGLREWEAAGLDIVASPLDPPDSERIDFLFFVHDRHDGGLESARVYLQWETELVGQLDPHERSTFGKLDALRTGDTH